MKYNQSTKNQELFLAPERYIVGARFFFKQFSVNNPRASLQCLEEILSHFSNFPYENLSKIIKNHRESNDLSKIRLPMELMEDHIRNHFGGTCFSLTFFLQTILTLKGFQCYPVMAYMRWGKNVHCALIVILNGQKFLVDPGYLLTRPMKIQSRSSILYHHKASGVELDFDFSKETYHVFTFSQTEKKWRYRFRDQPVSAQDFLRFWLSSFHWNSMHGLCLTKIEKDRMIYIHKTFMRETTFQGKRNFNIKKTVHETIEKIFHIDSVVVEEALSALEANMVRERELGLWVPKEVK